MQARMNAPRDASLPDAMKALLALSKATQSGRASPTTTHELVHLRASQINGCSVCVDCTPRPQGGR